jgi:SAM-dependent methyltransferase
MSSADIIIPIVIDLIKPGSVIDVGCGTGEFLRPFVKYGITDILGVDGEYVKDDLVIPVEKFLAFNLEDPLNLDRKFDLAICLEVVEHISPKRGKSLIKSLTKLAPIILFSAAIPGQGGANHINEQWITYWVDIFKEYDYLPIDAIRRRIWQEKRVESWYRQNIIMFCKTEVLKKNKLLAHEAETSSPELLSIVHPEVFAYHQNNR